MPKVTQFVFFEQQVDSQRAKEEQKKMWQA